MVVRELINLLGVKADSASFNAANTQVNGFVKNIARKLALPALATAMVVGIRKIVNEIADYGGALDDLSNRTGMGTRHLQMFEHVAKLTGGSLEDITTSVRFLQRAQMDAGKKTSDTAKLFKKLGVEVKDGKGQYRDTTDLIVELSDSFAAMKSPAERTAAAIKLFGKSGTTMIPALMGGSAAMREMMEEAYDLGGILSEDLVKASDEFGDNTARMGLVFRGVKAAIASEFIPILNRLNEAFFKWWTLNRQWISQKVGFVFKGVAQTLGSNLAVVGRIVKSFVDWVRQLSPLDAKIAKISLAIVAIGTLILSGPIGQLLLLAAAIMLVVDDLETWRKGGKSVTGYLIQQFKELLGIDIAAWTSTALSAYLGFFGDLWTGFKKWADLVFFGIAAIADLLINVWTEPEAAFRRFADAMKEVFSGAYGWIAEPVERAINAILSGINKLYNLLPEAVKKRIGWGGFKIENKEPTATQSLPMNAQTQFMSEMANVGRGVTPATPRVWNMPSMKPATTVNQKNDVKVEVHATPGMDEKKLAQHAGKALKDVLTEQYRAALRVSTRAPVVP